MEPSLLPFGVEEHVHNDFLEYVENLERNLKEHHRAMIDIVGIL